LHSFTAAQSTYSQVNPYDSLELKLASANADTQELRILKQLVDVAFGSDLQKALAYARRGVQLSDKIGDKTGNPNFMKWKEGCTPTYCN